ncbi:MAG: invasion associated locus B family protein, partial [Rhodovibrionaceae bacterium]|nr:invasion associated locus B family protein [Rhodovibrionaceae bacterium]
RRGDIYAMVAHRPAENATNVVSFVIGYTFQKESRVRVDIDGEEFTLFTHQDTAWAPDEKTDQALVEAMRAGRKMVVQGTSSRGTSTTDTYTLIGFTRAHKAINNACNVS